MFWRIASRSEALDAIQAVLQKYDADSWEASESVKQDSFEITSVCRDDLELAGFEIANVDDDTMKELVEEMTYAYCENVFRIHLKVIAEELDIPRKKDK